MGFLFLYLLVSVCCFLLIRYANYLEPDTDPKDITPAGIGIFVSLFPGANLLCIFTMTGYIIFIKYIKPNPSIFSDRWKKLNNWFTHGKL